MIQVNSKVRARLGVPPDVSRDDALRRAREHSRIADLLAGKTVVKEIFVPPRPGKTPLVNFVVKG